MQSVTQVLLDILYVVVTATVTILARYVVNYIESKRTQVLSETDELIGAVSNSTIADAIADVEKIVDTVSQTYVNSLKKENAFTKEAQETALNMAMDSAKELLSDSTKSIITSVYSDLDKWLRVQIESYILSTKTEKIETSEN